MGKGIGDYGGKITEDMDPEAMNRYKEFLSMDPEKFFEEKVAQPTMRRWREDVAPVISEGWAGGLRGSGRYRDLEESAGAVSERLGEVGGTMVPDIYGKQFGMAAQYKQMQEQSYQREYGVWLQSLPQFNPALQQAIAFLQKSTSTGKEIVTALDPGQKGWFFELLGMFAHYQPLNQQSKE
ncbi:hypothetical protein LCGC14_2612480 [marine sediment metagenome]|uniref:Uncharacterized protein n=1 Tax=marine sediment metagenome TaxID=412755 RepID=A0A0F9A5G7_9ZZZZ